MRGKAWSGTGPVTQVGVSLTGEGDWHAAEVEPPKGTIYNYPARPWHGSEYYIAGSSAPPEIAVQIWNRSLPAGMVARLQSGQSIKQAIAWAKDELEGFVR